MFDKQPEEWHTVKVEHIAARDKHACVGGPFGSNLIRKDYVETPGVPVSRGSNLTLGERFFKVEAATLEWFEQLNYTTFHASEIAPDEPNAERLDFAAVVLLPRLGFSRDRRKTGHVVKKCCRACFIDLPIHLSKLSESLISHLLS